jgi:hypothetical protein
MKSLTNLLLFHLLLFPLFAFAQTGTVKGRVLDENGEAVIGAVIEGVKSKVKVSIGESGQFEMKVQEGTEMLHITALGYSDHYRMLRIDEDSLLSVDIQLHLPAQWVEDDCFMRYNPDSTTAGRSTLSGMVTDNETHIPVSGVRISLAADFVDSTGRGHTCCCYSAQSDDRGRYTVHDIAPGFRTVFVYAESYRTQLSEMTVRPDASLTADFRLDRPNAEDSPLPNPITGRVWDAIRALPLSGVTVSLLNGSQQTLTGPDGVFVLKNPVSGRPVLKYEYPGFYTEWFAVSERPNNILLKPVPLSTRP